VVIHSYRHRYGLVPGDPAIEDTEIRLIAQPLISVPTIVLHGSVDGLTPVANSANHEQYFTGSYERRVVPNVGHNLPQKAPHEFSEAVLSVV
jgi:pimeloyl-ACP methyl ester carboxylesterase